MKRKILFLGLTLCFAFTLQSFAGGSKETKAPAAGEKVKIRFQDWHMTEDVWLKCLKETKALYEAKNPNVEIVFEPVAHPDKSTKYLVAVQAKNEPDVVHFEAQDIPPFIKNRHFMNLDPFIKKEGGKDWLKQWMPTAIAPCEDSGSMWAFPDNNQSIVLFYNTEMFKKAGLDPAKPPKTWEEFADYAKKLTIESQQWGFGMVANKSASLISRFLPVLWSFGGDIFDKDMTKSMLDSPESVAALKFYTDLYRVQKVTPPEPNNASAQNIRTFTAQGKTAMQFGSGFTIPIVKGINPAFDADKIMAVAPLPVGKNKVTFAQMDFWAMGPNTKKGDAAWDWMKYLTSAEIQTKFWKDNGVTSARFDVGQSDMVTKNKFSSVVVQETVNGRAMPNFAGMGEVNNAIINAVQEALTGQKTPEIAFKDAAANVNAIIKKYK